MKKRRKISNAEAQRRVALIQSYYDPRECWLSAAPISEDGYCAAEDQGCEGPCVPCIAYGRSMPPRPRRKEER